MDGRAVEIEIGEQDARIAAGVFFAVVALLAESMVYWKKYMFSPQTG